MKKRIPVLRKTVWLVIEILDDCRMRIGEGFYRVLKLPRRDIGEITT